MALDFATEADRFTLAQIAYANFVPWTIAFRGYHTGDSTGYYLCGRATTGFYPFIRMWHGYQIRFRNSSGSQVYWDTGTAITGAWHHFMFVAHGDEDIEYFYDNVSRGIRDVATNFYIEVVGRALGTNGWTGPLSEFAVFDKALNATERARVYGGAAGIAVPRASIQVGDLAAYWPLDDAAKGLIPSTVRDASGGGHNGTPVNAPVGHAMPTVHVGAWPLSVIAEAAEGMFDRRGIRTGGALAGCGIYSGGRM